MTLHRNIFIRCLWLACFAGLLVVQAEAAPNRWLLVFDTSPAMKGLYPTTAGAIQQFFTTAADGELQPGDELAVWIYNRQVGAQFPPVTWTPGKMSVVMTNLGMFLRQQSYATTSSLPVLQSPLSHVVAGSQRLTVVIFCDGQSKLTGTPYDDGINQSFSDLARQSKSANLNVIVLRSQLGQFVGCTLNYPPGAISYPPFPELPKLPANPVAAKPAASNVSATPIQSLEIVGTSVSTNGQPAVAEPVIKAPEPKPANTPPPVVVAPVTNKVSLVPTNPAITPVVKLMQTNSLPAATITQTTPPPAVVTAPTVSLTNQPQTKSIAAPVAAAPTPARPGKLISIAGGLVALAGMIGVIAFFAFRRRPHSSLISSSMDESNRRR